MERPGWGLEQKEVLVASAELLTDWGPEREQMEVQSLVVLLVGWEKVLTPVETVLAVGESGLAERPGWEPEQREELAVSVALPADSAQVLVLVETGPG